MSTVLISKSVLFQTIQFSISISLNVSTQFNCQKLLFQAIQFQTTQFSFI